MLKTLRSKILAAALGLAVMVFTADRILGLVPLGPESAEASSAPAASLSEELGEQMRATAALTNIPPAPRTLADRLVETARAHGIKAAGPRDAFRPPKAWTAHLGVVVDSSAVGDVTELSARQFAKRHKLTATVVGTGGGMAMIDGRCLAVGRQIDGMKLVGVDRGSATFRAAGVTVILRPATD